MWSCKWFVLGQFGYYDVMVVISAIQEHICTIHLRLSPHLIQNTILFSLFFAIQTAQYKVHLIFHLNFEYLIIMIINCRMTINGLTFINLSCFIFQFPIIFNWFAYTTINQSIDLSVCDDDYEHWLKIDKLAVDASANQLRHFSGFIYVIHFVRNFFCRHHSKLQTIIIYGWRTHWAHTKCTSENFRHPTHKQYRVECREKVINSVKFKMEISVLEEFYIGPHIIAGKMQS